MVIPLLTYAGGPHIWSLCISGSSSRNVNYHIRTSLDIFRFLLYTVYTYSFSHLAPGTCYKVPTRAPKWVMAYYLAPIFCDAIHHMI